MFCAYVFGNGTALGKGTAPGKGTAHGRGAGWEGHGFSRANRAIQLAEALASEVCFSNLLQIIGGIARGPILKFKRRLRVPHPFAFCAKGWVSP